jgi:UDP-N-acetylglucosamine 1-carboxyvinyltransferase
MGFFRVEGGTPLAGSIRVNSAKNAVLPILAASIMTREEVTLLDCPNISDAHHMADILEILGCRITRSEGMMHILSNELHNWEMPDSLSKLIRSSIFLLGPILGRFGRATVTYPGGCEIGMRPIDLHLSGLRRLGVTILEEGGLIHCDGRDMHAAEVHFDYPSVGATENVMMAAVLVPGTTTIHNAAREPEIEDLQRFINAMGGNVRGAGTHTILVRGVKELHGAVYRPIPDRIVAGTLLAAAAITGGEIHLDNAPVRDMVAVLAKLREMGCDIHEKIGTIDLKAPKRLTAFQQLQTQPHPGFPTDMQVQMLALAAIAKGTSIVVENVFENRFTHAGDLNRMGANIMVNGRMAIVQGVDALYGAKVNARDLRGGAALVIAGLAAQGITEVDNVHLIDRGYENLEGMLQSLGAKIQRIE